MGKINWSSNKPGNNGMDNNRLYGWYSNLYTPNSKNKSENKSPNPMSTSDKGLIWTGVISIAIILIIAYIETS